MARYSFLLALAAIAACTIPSAAPPGDTSPPTGTVLINNDDSYTVSTSVTLTLSAADDEAAGVTQMRVSNAADFAGAGWQSFAASLAWTLTDGDGPKTVYAAFRDAAGNPSQVSSDSIALDTTLPGPPDPPDLAVEDDTGLDNSDNLTRQTSGLTFSGTVEPDVTGGPSLDTTADLLLDGEAVGDASRFGFSVAPAGDVDRDGYGDLLIGAYYWTGAEGKAYLYRGGPAMDVVADLALYGAGSLSGLFGYSAASAGDVNGDGYADMVVGAHGENSSNGRAYLFRGGAA